MKRSLNQIGNGDKDSPPHLKRAQSDGRYITEDGSDPSFLLVHQNRELGMELRKRRREAVELQKQSEYYQAQLSSMEDRVGYIDRIWIQFEHDVTALLRSINKKEVTSTPSWNCMLREFLDAGKSFSESLPASVASTLDIDEWSSAKDVAAAKEAAVEDYTISVATKAIGDELICRLEFTRAAVEAICSAINSATGENSILGVVLQTYAEERAAQAERLLIVDQLAVCRKEVRCLQAQLGVTRHRLRRAERSLEASTHKKEVNVVNKPLNGGNIPTAGPSLRRVVSAPSAASSPGMDSLLVAEGSEQVPGADATCSTENVSNELRALRAQNDVATRKAEGDQHLVEVLEAQIREAEARRAEAEKSLLEHMTKSEEDVSGSCAERVRSNDAAEVDRVTRLLADMRKSCNKRLADVQAEKTSLISRVAELQKGIDEVTRRAEERMEEMCVATEEEVKRASSERAAALDSLRSAQIQLKQLDAIQQQMTEVQELQNASQNRSRQQESHISALQSSLQLTEANITASRGREQELENKVMDALQDASRRVAEMKSTQCVEDDEEGVVREEQCPTERMQRESCVKLQAMLVEAQRRCEEVESELKDAKVGMDDLIMEIEAVAEDEEKTRAQNARLLQQIAEAQTLQKGVTQENLRLQQEIAALQEEETELQHRADAASALAIQLENVLSIARAAEHAVRMELMHVTSLTVERKGVIDAQEATIGDLTEKLQAAGHALFGGKKKAADLRAKCAALLEQYETERNNRMTAERSRVGRTEANLASSGTDEETTMLDMTLNMLRCSVCKDRFKEVAITRCFHMFCKECIDENLRNRSRKCPACGEKFGQDDVKQVYFTN